MSKPILPTYRTTNWRSYNAALKQRGSLHIWFDPETQWLAAPSGKRGCSATFTDAAIQACLALKALFGLPFLDVSRDTPFPRSLADFRHSIQPLCSCAP